jgi:hypothetical protein
MKQKELDLVRNSHIFTASSQLNHKLTGEQGAPFFLSDPHEIAENQKHLEFEGFSVLVSDKISFSRALPDMRPKQ